MTDAGSNLAASGGRADRTDEKASDFLIRRYDLDGWNDADQAELDGWLEESLAHRTAYWRLKATWKRADRLDALRPMSPPTAAPIARQFPKPGLKLAAAITLLAIVGGTMWFAGQRPESRTFATAVGERSNLQLPDGSRVELTTNTTIRVANGATDRRVWLDKGEAFFQIVHDDRRPFVIHALDFKVVDLGTEFSVRREADRVEVMVLKGSVQIDPPQSAEDRKPVRLSAGETAVADNRAISVSRKSGTELADALSWRSGILVFRRAPLSEVAAEFNRYNTEKIVIDDPAVSRLTVSARLPATDVDAFARVARNFIGLNVKHSGDEIHLSRTQN
jgi:transmembrane sensor